MLLTEKFNYTVGKLRTKFGVRDAAYIKTDSQDTRPVKEILKKYKAWWNSQEGCWYWDLSKHGEWVLQNYVKPDILPTVTILHKRTTTVGRAETNGYY